MLKIQCEVPEICRRVRRPAPARLHGDSIAKQAADYEASFMPARTTRDSTDSAKKYSGTFTNVAGSPCFSLPAVVNNLHGEQYRPTLHDWLQSPHTSLLAWWIPWIAVIAGLFAPVLVRTSIWIVALS
jgi:hypothetical protein